MADLTADVLYTVLHCYPANREHFGLLGRWRRVSKKWDSTIDKMFLWSSVWLRPYRSGAMAEIADIVGPNRMTLRDSLVYVIRSKNAMQAFYDDIDEAAFVSDTLTYPQVSQFFRARMGFLALQLNPQLDEAGVAAIIDRDALGSVVFDPVCRVPCLRRLLARITKCMPLLRFMVAEHPAIAQGVFEKHKYTLQKLLLPDNTSVAVFEEVLRMEEVVGVRVWHNEMDSHIHWMCSQPYISWRLLSKIKRLVRHERYGKPWLEWVPVRALACHSMVASFLCAGTWCSKRVGQFEAIVYLINIHPASLSVVGKTLANGQVVNAFSTVVCRCTDDCNEMLVMVARMVMQYATLEDIRRMHNGRFRKGRYMRHPLSLLGMIVERKNRLVSRLITEIFDPDLTPAERTLLRSLEDA